MSVLLATSCSRSQGPRAASGPARPTAAEVHATALVVDTHIDTAQRLLDRGYDLATPPRDFGQVSLDGMRRGNVGAVFFSIWVAPELATLEPTERALSLLAASRAAVARHPDALALATSTEEILAARRDGKIAVLFGLEGAEPLRGDLEELRRFHALGVRYVGLTWNAHTAFADAGAPPVPEHGGLSQLGREAIAELNRLGILVDLSHLSDASAAQAIAASRAPVVATHSAARALANHRRNLPDELLRAIAAKGGVVQVNFHSAFLDDGYAARARAHAAAHAGELQAMERSVEGADPVTRLWTTFLAGTRLALEVPRPPLSILADHIEHVIEVAGIDHVGIGTDFDGAIIAPEGMDSYADLPKLTELLLSRGHSPDDIRKILGGNFMRVFGEAERVAAELAAGR